MSRITLERRFFVVNSAGDSEFDWLLRELGIPEEKRSDTDEVSFVVDTETIELN